MKTPPRWMKIPAVISAIFLGISLSLSLLAYNLENQLFNAEVYKQVLLKQNVCVRLPNALASQISSNAVNQNRANFLSQLIKSLNSDQIEGFFRIILPCPIIEKLTFSAIDQVFAQVNNATSMTGLSLAPIKESILNNSDTILGEYLNALPDCTTSQLLEIGANAILGGESLTINCNPPPLVEEAIKVPLMLLLTTAIQDLPDKFSLSEGFDRLVDTVRIARLLMNFSLVVPLIFLVLTALFAVRSWRSLLIWWGYPLLIGGLVTLAGSLLVSPLVYSTLSLFILPNIPANIVPEVIELISDMFAGVSQGLTRPIQIQSLILSILGIMMVAGEKFSRPK